MITELITLKPKDEWDAQKKQWFSFDCPACQKHRISIPVTQDEPGSWLMSGMTIDKRDLYPSIAHSTWVYTDIEHDPTQGFKCETHFFIRSGVIVPV